MLQEILIWWLQQMRDLLPKRWLDRSAHHAGALIIAPGPNDDSVVLRWRRRGGEQSLGAFLLNAPGLISIKHTLARIRPARCVLLLPPERLLERIVSLPLAVERDWPRVMRFEMDRLTPFAASDVFWAGTVMRRDRAQGRLELRLSLVPRAPLQLLLNALAQAGAQPEVLQTEMPDGQNRLIALERAPSRAATWRHRAFAGGMGVCALLAVTAMLLPFVLQLLALRRTDAQIKALRPEVTQAEAMRHGLLERTAGRDALAARRRQNGDPLAVLAAVTDALPDDSYLTELVLDQTRLSITGQSAAAARLISALAASPRLRNPVFTAPVTRNEAGRTDLFSIRAETVP
jgi:general secretion pathway protein L